MKKIYEILKCLENKGYETYIVGGYVRDKLLNKKSYDIDICTKASPKIIKEILPASKYHDCFCTSLKIDNYNIEITTFRKDNNYNGRKPLEVEPVYTLLEDLQRRDFTINTICIDQNGHVIDLMNGINDLNKKLIKCVGDSDQKIKEDSLRMLRAIRFCVTLDFKLDSSLTKAIKKYASNVKNLSSYRKREELDKILMNKNFKYGIKLFKKFNFDKYLDINLDNIKCCDDYLGMYAQMDIKMDNFFTSKEKVQINKLKEYLNKKIDIYDVYYMDDKTRKILKQITNQNLTYIYEHLPIKNDSDLDISYREIEKILLDKKIKYSYLKEELIRKILNKGLSNNKKEILNYINNNY